MNAHSFRSCTPVISDSCRIHSVQCCLCSMKVDRIKKVLIKFKYKYSVLVCNEYLEVLRQSVKNGVIYTRKKHKCLEDTWRVLSDICFITFLLS